VSDYWDSYLCRVNDHPASIFLNMSLREAVPFKGRPEVAWLFVNMQSPRPDGLSSREEFEKLKEIESRIEKRLAEAGALYVGRITNVGRRELYFYVPSDHQFERWADEAMTAFPDYTFEAGAQDDPESRQYLDVLYPTPSAMQQIKNRQVLTELKKAGDLHELARQVDHFAYFRDEANRDEFASWAKSQGFTVQAREQAGQDRPWSTELAKVQAVDPASIDAVTTELYRECVIRYGEYDGWGCPVVSPAKPPSFFDRVFRKSK